MEEKYENKKCTATLAAIAILASAVPAQLTPLSASAGNPCSSAVLLTHDPICLEFQEEHGIYNNLVYIKHANFVEITYCNDASVKSIEIPAEIDGVPVTKIHPLAFFACSHLKDIITKKDE